MITSTITVSMELKRLGKYEIVAKIGQGAMGNVHRAHDPILNRDVAIKTMAAGVDADDELRRRFHREAQSAAGLNHPNIVVVYDFGEEQGHMYIAMELLEGADLKEVITRNRPLSLEAKLDLVDQICDGLAFAHARGVIHRDLKPANIHLQANGKVKIMDFGLARVTSASELTGAGMMMGTPNYMSPEQVRGEKASTRSDVFALGAVFYELLAGRKAFDADSMAGVLFQVMQADPPPLDRVRPELAAIAGPIQRAMAKDPARRFAHAGELREALREARKAPTPDLAPARRPVLRPARPGETPSVAGTLVRPAEEAPPQAITAATVAKPVVSDPTPLPAITKRPDATARPTAPPALTPAGQETLAAAALVGETLAMPPPAAPPPPAVASRPSSLPLRKPTVAPRAERPLGPATLPVPTWAWGAGAAALAGLGFVGYLALGPRQPRVSPSPPQTLAPPVSSTTPASQAPAPTSTLALAPPPSTGPPVPTPKVSAPAPTGPSLAEAESRLAEKDFRAAATAARVILDRDPKAPGARRVLQEAERQIRASDELAARVRAALDANDAEKASQAFSQLLDQDPRRSDAAALAGRMGEVMKRTPPPATAAPTPVPATTLPPPPATPASLQSDAAARQAIRGVVDEYRAAFERRDADALRTVYPGIDYEAMKKTFASVTGYRVSVDFKEVTVSGNEGRVSCVVTYLPQPKPAQKIPPQATMFHLRRTGDVWRIERLERK